MISSTVSLPTPDGPDSTSSSACRRPRRPAMISSARSLGAPSFATQASLRVLLALHALHQRAWFERRRQKMPAIQHDQRLRLAPIGRIDQLALLTRLLD